MRDKIKKRIGFIVFLSSIFFFIILFIWAGHVRGYERTINVEKDSYVFEYYPDNNYGADDYLRVGNYSFGEVQAYYHFNISSLPDGWTEVNLLVNFDYGSNMVDIGANLTYESWDEMTITWNNKPNNSIYRGHILCDGFNFRIPLRPDQIINDGVSVCLFGRGEEINGFIQGNSKEGASSGSDIAKVELSYKGIDPNILTSLIIGGILIYIVIAVIGMIIVIIKRKLKKSGKKLIKKNIVGADWINGMIAKRIRAPSLEKEINQYITLKLEYGRTLIYVDGKRFIQCIRLILNIPKDNVPLYDEVDSIDEAAKLYSKHVFQNRIVRGPMAAPVPNQRHNITPEQEFWGHCSNIQAWVEHDYDTRILMSNISFPLLRELTRAGDPLAKKIFKEEIALRLESGQPSVVQYLINQGYIQNFSPSEFKTILESTNLIKNLSTDRRMLNRFLLSCVSRFPNFLKDILLQILKLPKGKDILVSSFYINPRNFPLRPYFGSNPRLLLTLKTALEELFNLVEEKLAEDIIDCINSIDNILKEPGVRRRSLESIKHLLLEVDDDEKFKIYQQFLNERRRVQSKCQYCGKVLPRGKKICDWCGHRKDDDEGGFFPYPYIFKPPGPGGGPKKGMIAVPVRI